MNHGRRALIAVVWALGCLPAASADEPLRLEARSASFARRPDEPPASSSPDRFGETGDRFWTVGVGLANNFHQTNDINLLGAYSYFLADNVEFVGELNVWYFAQVGDDAFGVNPTIGFRWHFYNEDPWSVFADVGIGLLVATDSVPEEGTSFDFTPRAGMGFTRRISDDGLRLQGGLRWHHISNARIHGHESNPGRDGLMLYAAIQWPF